MLLLQHRLLPSAFFLLAIWRLAASKLCFFGLPPALRLSAVGWAHDADALVLPPSLLLLCRFHSRNNSRQCPFQSFGCQDLGLSGSGRLKGEVLSPASTDHHVRLWLSGAENMATSIPSGGPELAQFDSRHGVVHQPSGPFIRVPAHSVKGKVQKISVDAPDDLLISSFDDFIFTTEVGKLDAVEQTTALESPSGNAWPS